MTKTRLLLAVAAVLVASSCASATQPALEVGSVELSRAELIAAIEDVGVPVTNTIARAPVGGPGFDTGIQGVISDLFAQELDRELAVRSLETSADDIALALETRGLPPGTDLNDLSEQERSVISVDAKIAVLDRALVGEGSSIQDWITQLSRTVRIDPRYGSWDVDVGFVPPALPGS